MRKTHREPSITPADETLSTLVQPEGAAPSAGGDPIPPTEGDGTLTGDGSGEALPPVEPEPSLGGETSSPPKTAWLTAAASEAFGAAGRFVDLTDDEAKAAPAGLLVAPTAEQLALRVR